MLAKRFFAAFILIHQIKTIRLNSSYLWHYLTGFLVVRKTWLLTPLVPIDLTIEKI